MALSEKPWGTVSPADYKDAAAYREACLIDLKEPGRPKIKDACKLPMREPVGD